MNVDLSKFAYEATSVQKKVYAEYQSISRGLTRARKAEEKINLTKNESNLEEVR